MHAENGQVISSATKWAHKEPRPIHTPKTPTDRNREDTPTAQGAWGEGGRHPGPEHTDIEKQIFKRNKQHRSDSVELLGAERSCCYPLII
jgi:hypothetical protein